jgi:hypothetical protein
MSRTSSLVQQLCVDRNKTRMPAKQREASLLAPSAGGTPPSRGVFTVPLVRSMRSAVCRALSRCRGGVQPRCRPVSATPGAPHIPSVPKQVIQLTEQSYAYLVANTREPAALAACREETLGRRGAHMQVPPEQGALLAFLIETMGASHVLEVGTFTGYSSTAMALALPPGGRLVTCDRDESTMELARASWERAGVSHKVLRRLA